MAALGSDVVYRSLRQKDWLWLQSKAQVSLDLGTTGIAVERRGELVAAVAFLGWMPQAATAHIAIEDPWVTRGLLRELFHYFFVSCGRSIMLAPVLSSNKKARRFVEWLGFQRLVVIQGVGGQGFDLILYELRKRNCRWLKLEYREVA